MTNKPIALSLVSRKIFLDRPIIMGIVNITPDSFSDGGKFLEAKKAIEHAEKLVAEGADILDIGGESTRPGAEPISVEKEIHRVIPVIEALVKKIKIPISIDTSKPEVADIALQAGAQIVNDITGLRDPVMRGIVVKYKASAIIMHMQGEPSDMQKNPEYQDVIGDILDFFWERVRICEEVGIKREKLILDPGIGFGKTLKHNLAILHNLEKLHALELPLCLGVSRKSFIGQLTENIPAEERLEGTLAANILALANGVQIFRVHDVKSHRKAFAVAEEILK